MRKRPTYTKLEDLSFSGSNIKEEVYVTTWSSLYLKLFIISLFFIVFIASVNLQVVHGSQNRAQSALNTLSSKPILAERGIIFDSNSTPLVYNVPAYQLYISNNLLSNKSLPIYLNSLSKILNISTNNLDKIIYATTNRKESSVIIEQSITKDQMLEITNDPVLSKIFQVSPYTKREYPYPDSLSHLLGYVGSVSANDLSNNNELTSDDLIGKDGLESFYDNLLRGQDGKETLQVDTTGQVFNSLSEYIPTNGDSIKLTLSLPIQEEMQTLLENAFKEDPTTTGAVGIVEDIHTGGVLAMVSLPTYNNNDFSNGISNTEYTQLINNQSYPLLNRAISEEQPPGSIMKTITASAALDTNAINSSTEFNSNGTFTYDGVVFQDYAKEVWGNLNVIGGLKDSSNIFFFNTILRLGINNLVKYQKQFGVGQLTDIDLPGEVKGTISDPATKQYLTGQVWFPGDSLNAAIGQGYTTVTPIQIVNWISAIANGGSLYKPHLLADVYDSSGSLIQKVSPELIDNLGVSNEALDTVKQGMREAVSSGIDKVAASKYADVAGKTGTAEFGVKTSNGGYSNAHSWFTGFAPYENPQIAIVIFLENGGLSTHSSIVASNFFNWYFGQYVKQ